MTPRFSRGRGPAPTARRRLALLTVVLAVQTANPSCGGRSTTDPAPTPTGEIITAADGTRFFVEEVVANLQVPWSLSFAPDGRLFFTERPGRVRVVQNGALVSSPALTIDDVSAVEESGALGLALAPGFASTHYVYVAYTASVPGGAPVNRLARYREVQNTLADRVVLLDRGRAVAEGPHESLLASNERYRHVLAQADVSEEVA
jgi:aldose sugar dehydrogenase